MALEGGEPDLRFVGKAGLFCPIKQEDGGALLMREKDGKFSAATGTKGFHWLEAEMIEDKGLEDKIDLTYFDGLVQDAINTLDRYGDVERFLD
jgi:hypothetical protein